MLWLTTHWEAIAGTVGAVGTVWKMLRHSDKAYRAHLSSHFPTKREFSRLEYKVDKLIALQLGERQTHLQRVPPPQD